VSLGRKEKHRNKLKTQAEENTERQRSLAVR
jgi:hypothetical protein